MQTFAAQSCPTLGAHKYSFNAPFGHSSLTRLFSCPPSSQQHRRPMARPVVPSMASQLRPRPVAPQAVQEVIEWTIPCIWIDWSPLIVSWALPSLESTFTVLKTPAFAPSLLVVLLSTTFFVWPPCCTLNFSPFPTYILASFGILLPSSLWTLSFAVPVIAFFLSIFPSKCWHLLEVHHWSDLSMKSVSPARGGGLMANLHLSSRSRGQSSFYEKKFYYLFYYLCSHSGGSGHSRCLLCSNVQTHSPSGHFATVPMVLLCVLCVCRCNLQRK